MGTKKKPRNTSSSFASWAMALILVGALAVPLVAQTVPPQGDPLKFFFDGKRGQVEVGGAFVGMEFHNSRPVPSRISFYDPVANSIDVSKDYWKRGESIPVVIGLKSGTGAMEWVQNESWSYELSPHTVTFLKKTDSLLWTIRYEFCRDEPSAVMTIRLKNIATVPFPAQLYTHILMSLRTCQTYARKDTSAIWCDPVTGSIVARFESKDTDSAAVFVQNAGERPADWTTDAAAVLATDSGTTLGIQQPPFSSNHSLRSPAKKRGIAAFLYVKTLQPGDSLNVVQVIGSCKEDEAIQKAGFLLNHWREQVQSYDEFIRNKGERDATFRTGDPILDRSAVWARALIAANAHYLNGNVVPMPCPAEYNFFFTHDLLLTNLGAVYFDLGRVKSNLEYVVSLAKDSVIPHAYYWRDDGYKTEYCEPENWNHLWFILVSGAYLRHSLDEATGRALYPFLTKSVDAILTRLRSDGLMYAYRPDWWDIGHIEGSRSYLTALTVRALREYLFISSFLGKHDRDLLRLEQTSERMQQALVAKLWDSGNKYLTNYNGSEQDYHYYAGSLIAVVYGLLDDDHARELVATAGRRLVDGRIGVRIAVPTDFSTDSVIRKFKFAGDEAGPPYSYANGGVWPHGNAWYAMALDRVGSTGKALDFTKRTMTIDGVAESPNGLPAMYEYRSSDPQSQDFGKIDKPSFLWAGGMYLQVLYRILAVDENAWNIGIHRGLPTAWDSVSCSMTFGGLRRLTIYRARTYQTGLTADGSEIPSRILPLDLQQSGAWKSSEKETDAPVLVSANAIVHEVSADIRKRTLSCDVSSFDGHPTVLVFQTVRAVRGTSVNGGTIVRMRNKRETDGTYTTTIDFAGSARRQRVVLTY